MSDASETPQRPRRQTMHQVFLRGLAISLPAILTIVILLWLIAGISKYIIDPTTEGVKWVIAQVVDHSVDSRDSKLTRLADGPPLSYCGENYRVAPRLNEAFTIQRNAIRRQILQSAAESGVENPTLADLDLYATFVRRTRDWLERQALESPDYRQDPPFEVYVPLNGRAVPYAEYALVARDTPPGAMPTTATGLYMEYAVRGYVGSAFTLSVFAVSLVIVGIYFLGRFVSVRLGSWVVTQVENRLLGRLPVIRNVYGSAKQVTDFLFSENQVEYRRVVAVEYPRRGIWSLGLVTGEGMLEITTAVGEPVVSILIPSSPMPVTGYTMCFPRSSVLDLDITVDQAFQFCISCGVLVPKHQKVTPEILERELTKRLAERMRESPADRRPYSSLPSPPTIDDDEDEESVTS